MARGFSDFDLSFVYVVFDDGTDLYWARSRVLEYLNFAAKRLPAGVTPALGPDAGGVGWVYEYIVLGAQRTLAELRSIQDWIVRYNLVTAKGVSEVASVGGFERQYQVVVDPQKLQAYGIPLDRVTAAVRDSNRDVGGRTIEMSETEYMVRGRSMRSVAVKTIDQQASGIILKHREMLVGQRTQAINALRGHATEFGGVAGRLRSTRRSWTRSSRPSTRVPPRPRSAGRSAPSAPRSLKPSRASAGPGQALRQPAGQLARSWSARLLPNRTAGAAMDALPASPAPSRRKILLPGVTALERNVARVRARASRRLWRQVLSGITSDQRDRLEALLVTPDGSRQSPLDRLRDGPVLQSPAEFARAIDRLDEVRALAVGLPRTDLLPRTRVLALARFASAAKAHAVARLPNDRRMATLIAFIRTLEATAQDDVLDLFDVVITRIFADAFHVGREARMRGLHDLDTAAIILRQGFAVLLAHGDGDSRDAVFATVSRAAVKAAIARVDALVRPAGDPCFDELLGQHRRVRRFFPGLVRAAHLGATPTARPLLAATEHMRNAEGKGGKVRLPLEFVSEGWRARVILEGEVNAKAWTFCLLDRTRAALRRRDLFAQPSFRYADPRAGLLHGVAWEAARPAVCRTFGVASSGPEEVARMSERLRPPPIGR